MEEAIFYTFLITFFIQLIYYIGIFIRIPLSREADKKGWEPSPVSVVISARNELENLTNLIPSLLEQDYPDFEIIVVNDRSTDGTEEYIKEWEAKDQRVKLVQVNQVPEHLNSKKFCLTLGIKRAGFEHLMLTDADCIPGSSNWIRETMKNYDPDADFVLGFSPYLRKKGLLNAFIRYETFLTGLQYLSFALMGKPYMGVGRNLSYKKSFFMAKRGFQGHLKVTGGDDDLFVNRHGSSRNTRVSMGEDSLVYSYPKTSLKSFFRQKRRHLSVGKFYDNTDKILLGLYSISHIVFWLTAIVLLATWTQPIAVISVIIVRVVTVTLIFQRSSKKLGDSTDPGLIWLLDFLYVFYYITAGSMAVVTKKIKWN